MTENNTNPPEDRADGPTDDQGSASEQIDPRRLAAERLSYLAVLQFQDRRRGGRRAEPWRDPRHGQGRALALLKLKPEMTQRELTYLMGMSRQSIAELLRKLEGQGLVERRPSEEDRRTVLVSLTEAGRAIDQDQDSAASSRPGLLDCLSDEEAATLAEFLGRIIDVLEERVGGDLEHRREMVAEFWRSRAAGPHPHGDHPGPTGFPGFRASARGAVPEALRCLRPRVPAVPRDTRVSSDSRDTGDTGDSRGLRTRGPAVRGTIGTVTARTAHARTRDPDGQGDGRGSDRVGTSSPSTSSAAINPAAARPDPPAESNSPNPRIGGFGLLRCPETSHGRGDRI